MSHPLDAHMPPSQADGANLGGFVIMRKQCLGERSEPFVDKL